MKPYPELQQAEFAFDKLQTKQVNCAEFDNGYDFLYTVRESRRAKHVNLKLSLKAGLEVVIPTGYNRKAIPEILKDKRQWIEKSLRQIDHQRAQMPAGHFKSMPDDINLRAINTQFKINYVNSETKAMRLAEQDNVITLNGNTENSQLCIGLLDKWLRQTARKHLAPWLRRTSLDLKLPYEKSTIRGQKTRWGSCSSQKNISLNYRLLFLPQELVQYLFVHELCHTRHMNHSARFWKLVEQNCPGYLKAEREMKDTSQYLPLWLKA